MMGYYTGFGAFDAMFTIVPVIVVIGFLIVFGSILVRGVQGAAQWKKNNDSPVLTVEAEVVAKRLDVQTWRHAGGRASHGAHLQPDLLLRHLPGGERGPDGVPGARHGIRSSGGGGPGGS